MHTVTVEEAKAHLDELIADVANGGEAVIVANGKAVARLAPPRADETAHASLLGCWKGKIEFREGWDKAPEDFQPYME